MTDTEIIDWMERNGSKLGIKPDFSAWPDDQEVIDLSKPRIEYTDIRSRVRALAAINVPNHTIGQTE